MEKLAVILLFFFLPFKIFGADSIPEYTVLVKDQKKGLTDHNGNIIIPPYYDDIGWSSGPPMVYHDRIGFMEDGKWGILNLKNEKITLPQFTSLTPYNDDVFIAGIPDKYKLSNILGLINYDGKPISGFLFNELTAAGNYFKVAVRKNSVVRYGIINDKGKVTVPLNYNDCSFIGYDLFSLTDKVQNIFLFNGNGTLVTRFSLDEIGPFQHDLAVIKRQGKSGLINTSGQVLLEPAYKEININENGKITYLPFNTWKLIDKSNSLSFQFDSIKQISPRHYIGFAGNAINFIDSLGQSSASYYNLRSEIFINSEIIARNKNKYGLLNSEGKLIYPFIYDSIVSAPAYVMLKQNRDSEMAWILGDHYGEIVNQGPFDEFFPVSNVYLLARRKGYWGIVYADGSEKINCLYDSIQDYTEGLLKVTFHHETGILWKNNWLIYPGNHSISILPDKKIIVSDYSGSSILNILGDTIYRSENTIIPMNDHFLERSQDNRYGLLSAGFERLLYPVCSSVISLPKDSLYVFHNQDGWGAIGSNDRTLFANVLNLDTILSYSQGFFKVIIDGDYGFIDRNGKLRIANRYQGAGNFLNGIFPVKLVDHWGFVNVAEHLVIQPYYDTVENQRNNLIIVRKDNRFGIIDSSGRMVQEMDYNEITPLSNEGFLCKQENRYGFIDKNGVQKIVSRFDDLQLFENGTFIARINHKYGIISDNGESVIPLVYDELNYDFSNHQLWGCVNAEWKSF